MPDLADPCIDKMLRMPRGGLQRGAAIVHLLVRRLPRDPVILDARETPLVRRRQMRLHVIEVEIESDVAVKITVVRIARIPFMLAPYLLRGIQVAAERGHAIRREDRSEHAITRTRTCVQQAMRVRDEPPDVGG